MKSIEALSNAIHIHFIQHCYNLTLLKLLLKSRIIIVLEVVLCGGWSGQRPQAIIKTLALENSLARPSSHTVPHSTRQRSRDSISPQARILLLCGLLPSLGLLPLALALPPPPPLLDVLLLLLLLLLLFSSLLALLLVPCRGRPCCLRHSSHSMR
jgi:hypothetical protein